VSFTVTLAGRDESFSVEMGTPILDAALEAGIAYPYSCRAGNCSTCKTHLIDGDIEMMEYSEFALSESERAEGIILACRAVPWSDCTVEVLDAEELVLHPERQLACTVRAIERATHDVVILRLGITGGGPMTYEPGQYARVTFPGLPPRDFSMATAHRPDELEFHLRCVPGGVVSGYVADRAQLGDAVRVEGPFGTAYLRERHAGPVVLAGGGTGLAPMLAMLDALRASGIERRIDVYVGMRAERDLYAHERLAAAEAAGVTVHRVLSEPDGATTHRTGYLADALRDDPLDLAGVKVYLAGPPVMVDTCIAALEARGVPRRDMHADAFYAATPAGATR
jgi:CDP-4-dehydro-6-deoxyglucose reductase/ferredoxin-NAD(P)+ reductase (naphthalene dioxygenase ferredoxin-specific)